MGSNYIVHKSNFFKLRKYSDSKSMKDIRNTVDVIYDHKTPKTLKICNNKNWFVYYSIYIQLDF